MPGLEPAVAIGTALITEVFGFASGVYGHWRKRTIDWRVVWMLVAASVPAAIVGSLLAGSMPENLLKGIVAFGLILIALVLVRHHDPEAEDREIDMGIDVVAPSVQRRTSPPTTRSMNTSCVVKPRVGCSPVSAACSSA